MNNRNVSIYKIPEDHPKDSDIRYLSPYVFLKLVYERNIEVTDHLIKKLKKGQEMDPCTIKYKDGKISHLDGLHRARAAKRLKIKKIPVQIIIE